MWETALQFLETNATALSAAGGLVAVILFIWAIIKSPFKRDKPTQLAPETIEQIKPPQVKDGPALTIPEFIRLRRELKADLEQELAEATESEKAQLRARIAELESQIANPDTALAEARKRIADLEALLDREANQIGGDRINEAKAALEQGDYSLADAIFAEIEARNELAVREAARAAYGRGEVAEAEVRWADAARHYADAARLAPGYETLKKAHEYLWRAGQYKSAHRYGADLVALARKEGTQEQIATALNEHAQTLGAQGWYQETEALFREALEIGRKTIGEGDPAYATRLNNLAGVVEDQGRVAEAEGLYREALEISRKTIGEGHPNYAIQLNNLALLVQAQGRHAEAEGLYCEALEIDRKTIGETHPGYAVHLGNLGSLLVKTGRVTEGRAMLEQALDIFRAALPADHPYIAETQRRLAALPDP